MKTFKKWYDDFLATVDADKFYPQKAIEALSAPFEAEPVDFVTILTARAFLGGILNGLGMCNCAGNPSLINFSDAIVRALDSLCQEQARIDQASGGKP